jgi:hypothetical protein
MLGTLTYVNILETRGYTREQAEAQVSLVREIMDQEFATKMDLERTESKLVAKIESTKVEILAVTTDLNAKLESLEFKLIIKMGTLMSIMTGILIAVLK